MERKSFFQPEPIELNQPDKTDDSRMDRRTFIRNTCILGLSSILGACSNHENKTPTPTPEVPTNPTYEAMVERQEYIETASLLYALPIVYPVTDEKVAKAMANLSEYTIQGSPNPYFHFKKYQKILEERGIHPQLDDKFLNIIDPADGLIWELGKQFSDPYQPPADYVPVVFDFSNHPDLKDPQTEEQTLRKDLAKVEAHLKKVDSELRPNTNNYHITLRNVLEFIKDSPHRFDYFPAQEGIEGDFGIAQASYSDCILTSIKLSRSTHLFPQDLLSAVVFKEVSQAQACRMLG